MLHLRSKPGESTKSRAQVQIKWGLVILAGMEAPHICVIKPYVGLALNSLQSPLT